MRDADDVVGAFPHQGDAERFYQAWGQRLRTCRLAVAAAKTRVIPCSRHQAPGHTSVDVLGFEWRWGQDRTGKPHRKRRTSRTTRRHARTRVTDGCQEQCRDRREDVCRALHAKRRGYDHDYGVNGNSARLHEFFTCAMRILRRWLNRRRQRRSDTWAGFRTRLHHFRGERPRIVGRPPLRLAAGRA
jgi:RNA-directed DNA polymerase